MSVKTSLLSPFNYGTSNAALFLYLEPAPPHGCFRLSNNTLASLQAKACARIVDVASTKRGRAWAFRDSNGNSGVRGSGGSGGSRNAVAVRGELLGSSEVAGESGDVATAVRCFSQAWGLDGI